MTFLTVARQRMAMRQVMQPTLSHLRRKGSIETVVLGLALLVVAVILGGKNVPAQTNAPQVSKPKQQQKASSQPAQEAIVERPPAPALIWPAAQPPNQAKVSWDSRGLEIEASNSSLNEILHQIAADTGAKLEGLIQDQRVFGSYGPGRGRDVLLKLLDGSGYNVLIIGGRDADAPLEIVLSARSPANPQAAANNQNRNNSKDNEAVKQLESKLEPNYPQEPSRPQPNQDPFANGGPQRDPLESMQEILQRQQKIDQQQQQAQQNNPQQ